MQGTVPEIMELASTVAYMHVNICFKFYIFQVEAVSNVGMLCWLYCQWVLYLYWITNILGVWGN